MSVFTIANARKGEQIKHLMDKRELCLRELSVGRPIPSYDPGGSAAKAEKLRTEALEQEVKWCEAEVAKLESLNDVELIAFMVPEAEQQRQAAELATEGVTLVDTLARGPRPRSVAYRQDETGWRTV